MTDFYLSISGHASTKHILTVKEHISSNDFTFKQYERGIV